MAGVILLARQPAAPVNSPVSKGFPAGTVARSHLIPTRQETNMRKHTEVPEPEPEPQPDTDEPDNGGDEDE